MSDDRQTYVNLIRAELAELVELDQWVAHRSKVPVNVRTGHNARSNDPTTWATFDQAVAYYLGHADADGLSFVFSEHDPFVGVDLDKCVDGAGQIAPWASEIVAALASYTEISPSGRGLHVWVRGDVPHARKRAGLEIYKTGRVFTVTGRRLATAPAAIAERGAELAALYATQFTTTPAVAGAAPMAGNYSRYALAALERETGAVALAAQGTRNDLLNTAAFALGGLVAAGALAEDDVTARLLLAAQRAGLTEQEAQRTIASGLQAGLAQPRVLPAPITNGQHAPDLPSTDHSDGGGRPGVQAPAAGKRSKKPRSAGLQPKSTDYLRALAGLGYTFRLNDCNDDLEVNSEPITDALRSKIRTQMRDLGYRYVNVMEDAYIAYAYDHRYNPVRDYLNGLTWDGRDHISGLAGMFADKHDPIEYGDGTRRSVFHAWLRRWLIGAVAKVFTLEQNPMLVIDGEQGIGKSLFARWLCSGISPYFIEAAINPEDKDCELRLISKFIWEVSELGATTRRADREALKAFITRQYVTVRKPYGHYDIRKAAVASLIGTINNDAGFLNDPTGSRRFLVCTVEHINWAYSDMIDVGQVWGQAAALWQRGERASLSPEENRRQGQINPDYEMPDSLDWYFSEICEVTGKHTDTIALGQVVSKLIGWGYKATTRQTEMALSVYLKGKRITRRRTPKGWELHGIRLKPLSQDGDGG